MLPYESDFQTLVLNCSNYGCILSEYCDASEFSSHVWIQKCGC